MTLALGTVKPGSTIYIPFNTFDSNDPSASVAIAALVAGDIEVYKDGGVTQRASDTGYTLLDTDGIDFDGHVGIGGFSIDLSSNATAGFYASGSRYFVVLGPVTVDAAVINFVAATFDIGYPDAILNTTVLALTSATQFTLTVGPAEADVLIGCRVLLHDVASAVQFAFGVVSDYIVTTKEVFLVATPVGFTPVATDNIAFFMPNDVYSVRGTVQTAGDIPALVTTVDTVVDGIQTDLSNATDGLGALKTLIDAVQTDLDNGTDGLGALKTLIDAVDNFIDTEIAAITAAVITNATGADIAADIIAMKAETVLIVADTGELQTDWVNGGRLDLIIDAINVIATDWTNGGRLDLIIDAINVIATDWTNAGRLDLILDLIAADTNELQVDWVDGGRLDLIIDAINVIATDWANGGRLDLLLDAIQTDLDNGTDGLGALKTLIDTVNTDLSNATDGLGALKTLIDAIQTDLDNGTDGLGALKTLIDTIDTVVDTILVDTAVIGALGAGLTDLGGMSTGMKAEVNAEADTALTDYDAPTRAELTTDINSVLNILQGMVLEQGTIGATGNDTTHLHLDGLTYGNDEINTYSLVIFDNSTSEYHVAEITDWILSSELATVATLPFTPEASVDTYWLLSGQHNSADIALILADTNELQTDWVDAGRLDALIDSIKAETALIVADTNELQVDWVDGGRLDLIIDAINVIAADWTNGGRLDLIIDAINVIATDWANGGRLDLLLDAIKAITDLLTLAAINAEVVDVIDTDMSGEPAQGAPPATASMRTKVDHIFKSWRNKKDNDGSTTQLFADDGTTVDAKQTTSESGGTVTKDEWVTGP